MAATVTIKKLTPKQKLIAKIEKAGGIKANRKALKELQEFVSENMPNINAKEVRKKAWK
ncbi:MAG: hypothetical protein JST29_05565 [Bacteroidetes bacterium]|nr:hypothetical protein [Bacteroidota bacterium]